MTRPAMITVLLAVLVASRAAAQQPQRFDHLKHRSLFPTCTSCHSGVEQAGQPLWPDSAQCAACHDGEVQPRVTWQYPESLRTNLRFSHAAHRAVSAGATSPACMDCHGEVGAPWMAVQPPVVTRCFACHGLKTAHLAAADADCATCHLPLAQAVRLTRADVAAIDTPPSHREPGFARGAGHGRLAAAPGGGVAASCATCHARDFCLTCHVDAPEQAVIQALAADPRSTAIAAQLAPPETHAAPDFLKRHGRVRADVRQCATCHTRESCLTCHAGMARVAAGLYPAGPGRGVGARITRRLPPSHAGGFAQRHAAEASARSATCAGCHTRADCLACHRPSAASVAGYHPAGFLARHPVAAYSRETNCSDCHNTGAFCLSCHAAVGLTARTQILGSSGYHDAKRFFGLGHGQAARQDLESCTGCHVERDCLTCHASFGARRFDPHGPGFDAARLRRKNPQMCTACHGTNIPN
jgi:cytochrome c7-like protein/doubled CXXCH motif protein